MAIFLTLFLLMGRASAVFADDLAMADVLPAASHSILGGTVKSVSWADSVKGTKSEITVKDTKGKIFNVLVTSTTTLWDPDDNAIILDKGFVKKRVNVIYLTTEEGINVGKSIKILK